ncbi:MAG: LUD domain-containing protein [Candidatus Doudnabacteria bacterium]|nr:LUD domain-containing protein [Candidatus Doudnabacteria bacterium]
MKLNEKFGQLASDETIQKTIAALKDNGIEAVAVQNSEAAKRKAFEIIPEGAEIMNMTSMTLESLSVVKEILESGRFNSVRNKLNQMDRKTQGPEMQKIGAAPEWVFGSVHAVTEDGQVLVASNTGSQLPAYAYGAGHVIWIVGAQKLVKNLEEGLRRLYEYSLPLENERAKKAYGMSSNVSKILIVNKELVKGRITMIIVKEKLGF